MISSSFGTRSWSLGLREKQLKFEPPHIKVLHCLHHFAWVKSHGFHPTIRDPQCILSSVFVVVPQTFSITYASKAFLEKILSLFIEKLDKLITNWPLFYYLTKPGIEYRTYRPRGLSHDRGTLTNKWASTNFQKVLTNFPILTQKTSLKISN